MPVACGNICIIKAGCKLAYKLKIRRIIQYLISYGTLIYHQDFCSSKPLSGIILGDLVIIIGNFSQIIVNVVIHVVSYTILVSNYNFHIIHSSESYDIWTAQ